jgi:hypothetical protein
MSTKPDFSTLSRIYGAQRAHEMVEAHEMRGQRESRLPGFNPSDEMIDEFATDLLINYLPKSIRSINQIRQIKQQIMSALLNQANIISPTRIYYGEDTDTVSRKIIDALGINRDPSLSDDQKERLRLDIDTMVFHLYMDLGFVPDESLEGEYAEDFEVDE